MAIIPEGFVLGNKADILPLFEALLTKDITDAPAFRSFLQDVSDLESFVSEDLAWRYIHMTCDTRNKDHEKSYLDFVQEIQPALAPLEDRLNRKIVDCPYRAELASGPGFAIYFRSLQGSIDIYREENTALLAEIGTLAQEYASVQGAMSIVYHGQEYTMQQAGNFLLKTDRAVREHVWKLMHERRNKDSEKFEDLFDKLLAKRHQVALNAGFANFRDYMFKALGRYDYTTTDCFDFHKAIEVHVVPLLRKLTQKRTETLALQQLKPWDLAVDIHAREPLKPFQTGEQLIDKTLECFSALDPYFEQCLSTMKREGLLDLDSRMGKAPGGYNYPLARRNMPFIFMNASGNLRDVVTMVHEGGHAIHSFLMAPLALNAFHNTPSEVDELASMSMELISMKGWNAFFTEEDTLKRAKTEQLEGIIGTLPWIANVDAFQHWLYENPKHTRAERTGKWLELTERFGTGMVDYRGLEPALQYSWHKQLHIFEVPFYYIEYGFAQLGAIGVWKQVIEKGAQGVEQYKEALKLGYTRSIPEIYEKAGISFDFSSKYVSTLFDFVAGEMKKV